MFEKLATVLLRICFKFCLLQLLSGLSKLRFLRLAVCHQQSDNKISILWLQLQCGLVAISMHYNCTHDFLVYFMQQLGT